MVSWEGVLTNESSNHNNLRTKSVKGMFRKKPTIGESFTIIGKSLSSAGNVRLVTTSHVVSFRQELPDTVVIFETETGSTYRLDYYRTDEV
jgi:hypothetical protein